MKKILVIFLLCFALISCSSSESNIEGDINNTFTSIFTTENLVHKYQEEGKAFVSHYYLDNLNANNNASILIRTNGKEINLEEYKVTAGGSNNIIHFYESPTITNNGTEIEVYNFNRSSSNNATARIYFNPTISNHGTEINSHLIIDNKKVGGIVDENTLHFSLKENATYLIQINNEGSTNEAILFNLVWYELEK